MPDGVSGWLGLARLVEWGDKKIRAIWAWIRDGMGLIRKMRVLWAEYEDRIAKGQVKTVEVGGFRWAMHDGGWPSANCNACYVVDRHLMTLDKVDDGPLGVRWVCPLCDRVRHETSAEVDASREEARKLLAKQSLPSGKRD